MTDFRKIALALEMVREDRKWYENVQAVEDALDAADKAAYIRGVNHGLTGKRERAVPIVDEYAPPVGTLGLATEETAQASAKVEIETPSAFYRGKYSATITYQPPIGRMVHTDIGSYLERDFYAGEPVPQPDGDCRFPNEAE